MSHPCHGLTGGIGSGKSTAAQLFADLGARIVDTDLISHELTAPGGAAMSALREHFGADYVNAQGGLERAKMRTLVFCNAAAKQRLEAILHPLIYRQARERAEAATDASYTLVVVPLLFESGRYHDWLHRVIVLDCPEEEQVERTRQRSGLGEAQVRAIMAQQIDRTHRIELADDILHNDGSLEDLRRQVDALHKRLMML